MKVSIITVCFNSGATIRQTIESVLSQTHEDIEHIIVDGGSKDDTMKIVDEYEDRLGIIVSEPDNGLYDAMNKGVQLANGDVVGILNSDDFFESENVIESVVSELVGDPELDVVFGEIVFVNPDDLERVVRHYNTGNFKPWKMRFGWMPPHPGTFIKLKAYKQVGKYRTDLKIAADYEFFIRLFLTHNASYKFIDKVIVRMRTGGASTEGLKSSIRLNREIVAACRDNGVYTNLALVLSKLPFKLRELRKRSKEAA